MFTKKIKAKFKVVASLSAEEEVALSLLASGVADNFYNMIDDPDGAKEVGDDMPYYKKLRDMIERPQEDVIEKFKTATKQLGLDPKKYLPLDLVRKMIKEWEAKTKIPFKDMPEKEQHRMAWSCIGHGSSPFDDVSFFDWMEEHGFDGKAVEKAWSAGNHAHFENDYNKIWSWTEDAINVLKQKEITSSTDFKVGDKVKYTGAFLHNTGQFTGTAGSDVGDVVRVEPMPGQKGKQLLYVKWASNPNKEQGVLSANVMLAGKPDYTNL
jgi:hypothetical protein